MLVAQATTSASNLSAEVQTITPASLNARTQLRFPLFALSCFLLAALISTFNNLPFSYDGSYQLLDLIERQITPTPHWRVGTALFMLPALLTLKLTDNLEYTSFLFSLAYATVPFLSLTSCWFLVRKTQPQLIIWPTIAFGLVSVTGQLPQVAETLLTCYLAWPLFLGLFSPPHKQKTIKLKILGFWIATLHPISIPFLFLTAGTAYLLQKKEKRMNQHSALQSLPLTLIALALLRLTCLFLLGSDYEMGVLKNDSVLNSFQLGFKDLTLWPIFSLPLLIITIFFSSANKKVIKPAFWLSLVIIILQSAALFLWSSHGENWHQTFHYARFLFLPSCLLMLCAYADSRKPDLETTQDNEKDNKNRAILIKVIACSFLLSMSTQCYLWHSYIVSLSQILKESPRQIVTLESLKDFKPTPINHWSSSSLAILIQGRQPKTLILSEEAISTANSTGKVFLNTWDNAFKNRFFKLPIIASKR